MVFGGWARPLIDGRCEAGERKLRRGGLSHGSKAESLWRWLRGRTRRFADKRSFSKTIDFYQVAAREGYGKKKIAELQSQCGRVQAQG